MLKLPGLIVKRLFYLIITLLFISLIIFFITQILPGDVAEAILGQSATEENVRILREQLGLNRPVYEQYFSWLKSVMTFELGNSMTFGMPIGPMIKSRLSATLLLGAIAFVEIAIFGIILGVASGLWKDKLFDKIVSICSFTLIAIPEFVSGSLLVMVFGGVWLQVFPASGYAELNEGFVPWIMHLILPSTTLTMVMLAYVIRMTRASTIEVLRQNYIRTARLNGLKESRIIWIHALKNALLPTITLLANNIGWLVGGVVIVETVFGFPGIGRLLINAINNRDIPLIQNTVMVIASFYIVASILSDILYSLLDPRTRK